MAIPHPIPYQGSKRHLAQHILPYIPADTQRLIEPFAGSAAMSLAVAAQYKASGFIINDINAPLMTLWQMIIEQPDYLASWYTRLWHAQQGRERRYYDRVRDRFNRSHRPHYFLYLLARCVKASVRYNANGEFNQSPDNRRKGRNPRTMRRDILGASALLAGKTRVIATDYADVVQLATPQDVIYFDPPYQGVSNQVDSRYIAGMNHQRFVTVLEQLNQANIAYIVSYDGRTGKKSFGEALPSSLELLRLEINAGRSTQATLLGRQATTVESLYLSSALLKRLNHIEPSAPKQLPLMGEWL